MSQFDVLFAAVPVTDLRTAVPWYERLFGRPPDIRPNEREVMWAVAERAWLYVVDDPDRAGGTVVSMCVADLDDATEHMAARGIEVASTETIAGAGRKAWLADPDGNSIAIIEVIQPDQA